MNSPQQQIAIFLLAVFTLGCGDKQPSPVTEAKPAKSVLGDIAKIATSYQELRLMTPEPVLVSLKVPDDCRSGLLDAMEEARIANGPHADCMVRIFMDERAATAFENRASYPVGSVIVKEKELNGTANGVGGMIKRKRGYDETHGDWEYFYFENPASIESGKIESCRQCHQKTAASDYVFADWATPNNGYSYGN